MAAFDSFTRRKECLPGKARAGKGKPEIAMQGEGLGTGYGAMHPQGIWASAPGSAGRFPEKKRRSPFEWRASLLFLYAFAAGRIFR